MQKRFRLRSRIEFQKVYGQGRSQANRAAVAYCVLVGRSAPVVGFAVGRKLGTAVVRNRVKRRLREAVRQIWARAKPGVKVVLIGRAGARDMPFSELARRVEELLVRLGAVSSAGIGAGEVGTR